MIIYLTGITICSCLIEGDTSRLGFNKWQNWNRIVHGRTLVLHLTELVCLGRQWAVVMRSLRRQFRQTTQRARFSTWPSLLTGAGIKSPPFYLDAPCCCCCCCCSCCSASARAQSHSLLPWVNILPWAVYSIPVVGVWAWGGGVTSSL